ncbi:MAG TPA: NADH:flavin oxidoreductase/NADH oxidase [Polyangia bacterium]|jgi:2,4-dienoyl-CoA reductase-like NADH-dependent reductase (Old Yellow Enzyme family)|nr:NADH:flavin oxidoreductase/NADH oxidase [Polyangia bacterium]
MLFDPFRLRGLTFRNRIGVSPMCQYSSTDGFASDWHLVHLGSRAVGGAGLVMAEATAVEARGRISPEDLGLWKDEHIEALARVATFVRAHGAAAGIQLAHAGRKASVARPWDGGQPVPPPSGWTPIVAPSAIPFGENYQTPQALTAADIAVVIAAFAAAATRAAQAGFDVVEIHAAHGYLLHEFLSPLANRRTDQWGGTFDNRIRLVLDVVRAVRAVWADSRPLLVRLSTTDWVGADGWTVEDSIALSRRLRDEGVDLIDCSTGGIAPKIAVPVGPGYQTANAARIRAEAPIPTAALGLITSATQAEHVLRTGQADMVFLARAMLNDPYWPLHAAAELGITLDWPAQYDRVRELSALRSRPSRG